MSSVSLNTRLESEGGGNDGAATHSVVKFQQIQLVPMLVIIEPKTAVAAGVFALLWAGESFAPFYSEFKSGVGDRLRHDGRNLALGFFNALLTALLFGGAFAFLESWGKGADFGLLRTISWPIWAEAFLVVVLFDLWMYLWHRANHRIPFLWRFHRMHHSDREMDVSTGVRFHPGEIFLSGIVRLAVVPLLGMNVWHLVLYESLLLPVVLFHHSNVSLPRWLDYGLLYLIVTPAMHRVHHSRLRAETDSNYGSIFPYWDVLFRSFGLRSDAKTIELGLDEFQEPSWLNLAGMLKTPLKSRKK